MSVLEEWQREKKRKEEQINQIADLNERNKQLYDEQKRQFGRLDRYLDVQGYGPTWLQDARIAKLVADSLHHFDEERYRLDAYCIMSNHGH